MNKIKRFNSDIKDLTASDLKKRFDFDIKDLTASDLEKMSKSELFDLLTLSHKLYSLMTMQSHFYQKDFVYFFMRYAEYYLLLKEENIDFLQQIILNTYKKMQCYDEFRKLYPML